MHGQDEIAALDFEAVDDGFIELLDRGFIRQLAALQLPEQLPCRIISVDGDGELILNYTPENGHVLWIG